MKNSLSNILTNIVVTVLVSLVCWAALEHITRNYEAINAGYSQFTVYLTLTTLIATLLAIAIAVVFGVNWVLMDKKLQGAVNSALEDIDTKVQSELERPLQATTGFLVSIMDEDKYGPNEMAEQVQKQLSIWNSIPNARTYVAERYVSGGYTISDPTRLLEPDKENLNSAMTWIEMAREQLDSEDLKKLLFLEALRAAILNAPDFCIAALNKLIMVTTDSNFDALLSMPYAKELFSLCGTADDALRISELLNFKPSKKELEQKLKDLTSSEPQLFCLIGRLKNTDALFVIQVTTILTEFTLNPLTLMTRSNIPEEIKIFNESSATDALSKLTDLGYVITSYGDLGDYSDLLFKQSL